MEIITDIEKLSERADEIDIRKENNEARDIVVKIKKTIRENNLASLSAPQIGFNRRIFCINFNGDIKAFVNPIIAKANGLELSRETCPSIPGRTFIRPRNNDIDVMYQTPLGKPESRRLIGLAATVFQHEMDHLDGILLTDIGLEIDEAFDNATDEERNEVIDYYLDSLDLRAKDVKAEVKADPELGEAYKAIEFSESVQRGDTQIEFTEE